jgi:hypothetical protein
MIGVDHSGLAKKITELIPDYMVMGERGRHRATTKIRAGSNTRQEP